MTDLLRKALGKVCIVLCLATALSLSAGYAARADVGGARMAGLLERRNRAHPRIPVLMYHEFGDAGSDLYVRKGDFVAQLKYLREKGYRTLTLEEMYDILHGRSDPGERDIVLTFDDGYLSHYEFVYPLLKEYGMKGAFFIIPGYIGAKGYLTWQQVIAMARDGMDIGAHSYTHPDLRSIRSMSRMTRETLGAREDIERRISMPVRFYCYPGGRYDGRLPGLLAKHGYLAAFGVSPGWASRNDGMYSLKRVRISRGDTLEGFARKIRGE